MDLDTRSSSPPRKKRRPALACEQCRRRKIKCDRLSPCQQCVKANIDGCQYIHDSGQILTTAPFDAQDIQFSVFEQMPRRPTVVPMTGAPSTPFDSGSGTYSDSSSLTSFLEPDELRPAPALSPAVWPLGWDLELSSMFDDQVSSAEPTIPPPAKPCPPVSFYRTTGVSLQDIFKSKFYRRSHWTNFAYQSSEVTTVMQAHETDGSKHGCPTFSLCKAVAKTVKMQEQTPAQPNRSMKDIVPTKVVSDRLVQAYFRTFQTVFGVLHVPSFRKHYKAFWEDSGSVSKAFDATLLVVMCIGSTFCSPETTVSRATTLQWIDIACTWLSWLKQQNRPSLESLRIQLLIVLARQLRSFSGDNAWLSTGSLVRMAMHMGLHIDPEAHSSPSMCPSDIEAQRRLWAAIVELELQSSMDCGSIPGTASEDYDCALPSNIDDAHLEANTSSGNPATAKPIDQLTQSSIQILLMKTAPIRLEIARFINSFQSKHSFEEALSLSSKLLEALKSCTDLISSYCMSSIPPTPFQTKMFDLLVQRFVLGLHQPFAVQAMANPSYYYSRKVSLETSFLLASHLTQPGDDDFYNLRLCGKGLLRVVYAQCALYLCGELTDQSEVDRAPSAHPGNNLVRKELRKAVEKYLEVAVARMSGGGEKSIKCYILVSCMLAHADAVNGCAPVDQAVSKSLKKGLETAYALLSSQVQDGPERLHAT